MASSIGISRVAGLVLPSGTVAAGYSLSRARTREWLKAYLSGSGKWKALVALLFCLLNWKSLPFAWTIRVWRAMIYHLFVRPRPYLPPRVLFHHSITTSYTSLLETDYNLHKSNSTYFADLDVSRTHLVSHLFRPGLKALAENETTKLVLDPRTNAPVRGRLGVMLGAVHASFRREIRPLERFQMWSRVLAWDRKWLYIVTHFVRPTEPTAWDWRGRYFGRTRPALVQGDLRQPEQAQEWQKRIFATCVSKYVFKLGRLTVNPAVIIQQSGFLPEGRPGGWTGGELGTGFPVELNGFVDIGEEEWGWQHIEKLRLEGLRFAEHFAEMDKMHDTWDAGEDGALGHFAIG